MSLKSFSGGFLIACPGHIKEAFVSPDLVTVTLPYTIAKHLPAQLEILQSIFSNMLVYKQK